MYVRSRMQYFRPTKKISKDLLHQYKKLTNERIRFYCNALTEFNLSVIVKTWYLSFSFFQCYQPSPNSTSCPSSSDLISSERCFLSLVVGVSDEKDFNGWGVAGAATTFIVAFIRSAYKLNFLDVRLRDSVKCDVLWNHKVWNIVNCKKKPLRFFYHFRFCYYHHPLCVRNPILSGIRVRWPIFYLRQKLSLLRIAITWHQWSCNIKRDLEVVKLTQMPSFICNVAIVFTFLLLVPLKNFAYWNSEIRASHNCKCW